MIDINDLLKINPEKECDRISSFLTGELKRLNHNKVIIGLSGGLDSATTAYLAVKALGSKKVIGVMLPERDSNKLNIEQARIVASELKIKKMEFDITPILDKAGVYKLFPKTPEGATKWFVSNVKRLFPYFSPYMIYQKLWFGDYKGIKKSFFKKFSFFLTYLLTKVKVRMTLLYHHACLNNAFVLGTTDKTEWLLGLYDKYGDGAHDISLLKHLYKSQVKQLAVHLGVPESIINKPADPDLFPGANEEAILGINPELVDKVLACIEKKIPDNSIAKELGVKLKLINQIKDSMRLAIVMKGLPRSI